MPSGQAGSVDSFAVSVRQPSSTGYGKRAASSRECKQVVASHEQGIHHAPNATVRGHFPAHVVILGSLAFPGCGCCRCGKVNTQLPKKEDVTTMLNSVNRNGLACIDLSLKGESGMAQCMSHYFHAKHAKPNPKKLPGFDPQQWAPSGWDGRDWHHYRRQHVHPNVGMQDDNRRQDWKSNRRMRK